MSKNSIPELLAPAGSIETLKASVNAGADAVYLSGKKFGARQFAPNFNLKEMEEAINYAHIRGVKAYVTVNTLIKETELSKICDHLFQVYSMGADAIIVQDLGVARLAKKLIPDMDLHCSTQMTIHNPKGVSWAADNGFKRVILAREMSLKDIELAAQENVNKNIELEVFAHGAICYSYSGQCLLSSFIGGRSGNRGMCAQPCRKNYQLILAKADQYGKYGEFEKIPLKDHYLLSTKDLAIYPHLEQIAKSSVDSIKIEGRMRPPEYVANVVKIYREALDLLSRGKWKPSFEDILRLKMCFNRGLTSGWIFDKDLSVMGRDSPGNRGLYLGKVTDYNKNQNKTIIRMKNKVKLEKGDGILFKDPEKTGKSADIWGAVLEHTPTTAKDYLFLKLRKRVKIGTEVFITRRKCLINSAENINKNTSLPHKIPLEIEINWDKTFTPLVRATASPNKLEKIQIQYKADFSMEKAIKKPLSKETIIKHLKKTGGTPFIIQKIWIDYPGNLFTPISNLNHLRREILEEVQKRIITTYQPSSQKIEIAKNHLYNEKNKLAFIEEIGSHRKPGKVNLAIYVDSNDALEAALESGCKTIYYQPKYQKLNGSYSEFYCLNNSKDYKNYFEHICSCLYEAKCLYNKTDFDLIWKWPDITSANFIKGATRLLNILPENTIDGVMVGNLGALWGLKKDFSSVKIYGSKGLNIWNHMAIDELSEHLQSFTLSPEISQEQLKKVISHARGSYPRHNFQFLIQGNLETMVSEDCLPCFLHDKEAAKKLNIPHCHLGIRDSRKRIFPVEIDQECRTLIFNSAELCLIDYLPKLRKIGLDSLIIDARNKPADYIRNIFSIYHEALELTVAGDPKLSDKLDSLKERVRKISNGGITRGNFIRGTKEDN